MKLAMFRWISSVAKPYIWRKMPLKLYSLIHCNMAIVKCYQQSLYSEFIKKTYRLWKPIHCFWNIWRKPKTIDKNLYFDAKSYLYANEPLQLLTENDSMHHNGHLSQFIQLYNCFVFFLFFPPVWHKRHMTAFVCYTNSPHGRKPTLSPSGHSLWFTIQFHYFTSQNGFLESKRTYKLVAGYLANWLVEQTNLPTTANSLAGGWY